MAMLTEQNEQIAALRGLIERLSAPDVTLDEASVLRQNMMELLDRGQQIVSQAAIHPSPDRDDLSRPGIWPPTVSMRVAG
jgi:hypothetical protein